MNDYVGAPSVSDVMDRLHAQRAPKGTHARVMSPVQVALRNLDHVWGADVVDRMREVAEFLISGDSASVEEVIAAAVAGKRSITREKLDRAIRNGANELARVAHLPDVAETLKREIGFSL